MSSLDYIAIVAVMLIGVPHGGLDGAIARRAGWSKTFFEWLIFHSSYLLLAIIVAIIWWYLPGVSLTIFLILSAIHFGTSDIKIVDYPWKRSNVLPLISHCGLIVIGIPGLHPSDVQPIFTILAGEDTADLLVSTSKSLLVPWLLTLLIYLCYSYFHNKWVPTAWIAAGVFMSTYILDPLISFALYFCLIHSPIHTFLVWTGIKPQERLRSSVEAAMYTLIAWLSGIFLVLFFLSKPNLNLEPILIKVTFIGLAALTVPHMILIDLLDKDYD